MRPDESIHYQMDSLRIRVYKSRGQESRYWLVVGAAGIELKPGDWVNLVKLLDEDEVAQEILGE